MNWQDHIVFDEQVLLGKPTLKGIRISVELVLELFIMAGRKIKSSMLTLLYLQQR